MTWSAYVKAGIRHLGISPEVLLGALPGILLGGMAALIVGVGTRSPAWGLGTWAAAVVTAVMITAVVDTVWHTLGNPPGVGWSAQGYTVEVAAGRHFDWRDLSRRAWPHGRQIRRRVRALSREAAVLYARASAAGVGHDPEIVRELVEIHQRALVLVDSADRARRSELDNPRAAVRALSARLAEEDRAAEQRRQGEALLAERQALRSLPGLGDPDQDALDVLAADRAASTEVRRISRGLAS